MDLGAFSVSLAVRDIAQRRLMKPGVPFQQEADESTTGPTSFTIADPDGTTILFDQHV